MQLIKIYIIIFALTLKTTFFSVKSIFIFGKNGYQENMIIYENAIKHAKELILKKDKSANESLETVKKTLNYIEENAIKDIIGNALLRSYLVYKDFLSNSLIYLNNPQEENEAINNLKKKIQEKKDEIIACSLEILQFETNPQEQLIQPQTKSETKKEEILTQDKKESYINELNNMKKPIEEYKKLVYTQKQIIFRYIDKIINEIKISTNDKLITRKIELIKILYNKLFSINIEDSKAIDKANETLTNFSTEYNRIK